MIVRKISIILLASIGYLLMTCPTGANAFYLEFDPYTLHVVEGTSFTVDLFADIPEEEAILGWDIDLLYDDTQLDWTGTTVGSKWNQVSIDSDGLGGLMVIPPPSIVPPPIGPPPMVPPPIVPPPISGNDILLATLSFECLAIGTSTLDIFADPLDLEGFLLASGDFLASWTSRAATVNQVPVPEPATVLLVGSGIIALVGLRRKFRMK
jgi:hypothetical protein